MKITYFSERLFFYEKNHFIFNVGIHFDADGTF